MKNKKKFTVVIVAMTILLVLWVVMGFEGNELPYATISELKQAAPANPGKRFRLGGTVERGSIVREPQNQLALVFVLEQGSEKLPVSYNRIVPDMFKDGSEVIVEGYYVNGEFQADNLMTKCASRYEGDLRETAQSD